MAARLLAAALLAGLCASPAQATTRRYFVQAEKDWWNFAQDGDAGLYINNCTGLNYTAGSELYMQVGAGARYLHARYVAYTDDTFQTKYVRPADEVHLQIAGPWLRAAVGDTLEVVFSNALEMDTTLTPTGVELAENDTEPVAPGEMRTYSWNITERIAPGANESSSKMWIYTPAIDTMVQQNMGLFGGLIVTRADAATADGRPNDTDIELLGLFHVFDENANQYFNETLAAYELTDPLAQTNLSEGMWEEANLMHSINGKMFCWNEGMVIPAGKRARWHIAVIGGEPDIHNFHWHGMVLNITTTTADQFSLFPGSGLTGDLVADNPGTWLFHCHVNDHIHAGMLGLYTLEGAPITEADQGDVQQYYIAANEVEWDYTPHMADMCSGVPANFSEDAAAALTPSNFSLTIGHKQIKALFEEYTDASFTTKKAKDPSLGFLGPTLRAKVGDTIRVTFKNNARFTTGLHPHGVLYAKSSEGAPYNDGTPASQKVDDAVHTGQTATYTWYVTDRTAPGPADGSSVVWMYHSHSHEIQDSYAGLMGAIVVTRKEMATADNRPRDVDREYVLMFSVVNEMSSFMLRANLAKHFPGLPLAQYESMADAVPEFAASENLHAINGYLFCNGPSYNASTGERVRFYIITLGTEADLHTPDSQLQWTQQGHRSNALISIAGDMQTADVVPLAAGEFQLQCRTAEHVEGGMMALFRVEDSGKDLLARSNGTERTHYVAANELTWDYIPSGEDLCTPGPFDEETAANWGEGTMGHVFKKAVYQDYADGSFATKLPQRNPSDGIAGPTLHAEVGDILTVVFMNNLSFPANLQLAGGFVPLHNESLVAAPVEPGEAVTYSWLVTEANGPGASDDSTVAYFYGSNVDQVADLNAGLYGATVVARKGELQASGLPLGIDQEIPLFFNILDEAASSLFEANLAFTNFTAPDELTEYDDWAAWGPTAQWNTINGFSWCNQAPVVLNASSTVRWVLVGLGNEVSMHTPAFTNAVLLSQGSPVYTTELAPSVTMTLDMRADFVGKWEYRCDVQEHFEGGMRGTFYVQDPTQQARITGNAN